MNRSELVQHIAEQAGINRTTADQAVDAMFEAVMSATKSGEKVQLFGFGTFTPTARAARTGRNPQTGEPVKIAASRSVRFAPAAAFKTALNGNKAGAKKATAKKSASKKSAGAKKATPARKAAAKSTASSTTKRAAKKTARKR
jgi:DNA-binding protein HU-beta